ncbi:MAG: DUF169 domain-containing protein [Dehalococcoidales bacterium]|nr:DUF169 domain-containing protein [Dehalococcoidales bacterium]
MGGLSRSDFAVLERFGFATPPVGVKFTTGRPELPRLGQRMTLCEMVRRAQEGNAFYPEPEDHTCDAALYVMGMKELATPYINGEYGAGLQVFGSARAARRLYQHIYRIEKGTVGYIAFAPLEKLTFDPDVLLITASTAQAEIILRASSYETGDMWVSKYTPALGCDWLIVYPFVTGQINHTVTGLGFGMRRRRIFPEGQHFIAVPFDRLKGLLETLTRMPWVPEAYRENGMEYVRDLRRRLGLE